MIKEKTVFILGAGASAPYGYPTGKQLRVHICGNFAPAILALIEDIESSDVRDLRRVQIGSHVNDFVSTFEKSGNESINLWLNRNKTYSEIGKLAIALNIIKAEHESRYHASVKPGQDWCRLLFQRMTSSLTDEDGYKFFKDNQVAFITFNYDRSFEHYMYELLTHSYTKLRFPKNALPIEELFPFRPIHVFGKIADLPWESKSGLDYRCDFDYGSIDKMKEKLQTIFEGTDAESLMRIESLILEAERVFFLGFGYHKENLEVIGMPRVLSGEQKIYGTALGFTGKEIKQVKNTLGTNFSPKQRSLGLPIIENMNCYDLLRTHL